MKPAFIFDFDGTIAETLPLVMEAFKFAYTKCGVPVPAVEDFYMNFGPTEQGTLYRLNPDHADKIFSEYLSYYEELHHKYAPKPYDGMMDILLRIKASGCKLGLVTGKNKETANISLDFYGMRNLFSPIKTGAHYGSAKTLNILEILSTWNANGSDSFYFGDSVQDMPDARAAGVNAVAVAWAAMADREKLMYQAPLMLFDTPALLSDWLKEKFGI